MAKRSDFAQKLLDDLRLRKEKMAASQSSKGSRPIASDAYAYSKKNYEGSREMKRRETTGFRTGTMQNRSSGGNKLLSIGEASKEIVPFGRGRSTEPIGDLSKALAFAIENGGKLGRMDSLGNSSMFSFLNKFSRKSVDVGRMGSSIDIDHSSSGHFPTLSHLHIKEISRAAQKLNQILRGCSSGLNFDSYSIKIGKELLKGAMDLEESLRMLVNLQEASEYMMSPQRQNRIVLLDEDEDVDDNPDKTAESKQLALPRFSFDKPSKNSHYIQEVARTDLKQRIPAPTNTSEATNFNANMHPFSTLNTGYHKRTSYSPDGKNLAAFSEQKNHSSSNKSKPEKGRLPNVIAKLMGLEELPENEVTKDVTNKESKQEIDGKPAGSSTIHEHRTKDAQNLVSPVRKENQIQSSQIQIIESARHSLQAEKNLLTRRAASEVTTQDGKLPQKNVEGIKAKRTPNKVDNKINRHQSNNTQLNQTLGSRNDNQEKERKQDNTKLKEQKGTGKAETKEISIKHELQKMAPQTQKASEATTKLQGQPENKASLFSTEKGNAYRLLSNNQSMFPNPLAAQHPYLPHNFDPQDIKHRPAESEQKSAQQKFQVEREKGDEAVSRNLPKAMLQALDLQTEHSRLSPVAPSGRQSTESIDVTKSTEFPENRHHKDIVEERSSTYFKNNVQNSMNRKSDQDSPPTDVKSQFSQEKKTIIPPATEENPISIPTTPKVKMANKQQVQTLRKIDELMARRTKSSHNLARSRKQQSSILQEVKQRKLEKLAGSKEAERIRTSLHKEAEGQIVKSNKPAATSIQQSNMLGELQLIAAQASNLQSPPVNDKCLQIKTSTESGKNMIPTLKNDQEDIELDAGRNELRSQNIEPDALNGTYKVSTTMMHHFDPENHRATKMHAPEPLNESETHLKKILMKSQLFLNTAEALFKLDIPLGILQTGDPDSLYDEDSKLTLDCGYEIMKRKGKRQELSVHPFTKRPTAPTSNTAAASLDDLIRQLHKDLVKLKSYGRNGNPEAAIEDYLPKMLEIDVYNADSDVNCMWDLSWNELGFAFLERHDVVRDVEKLLLNGLLDEVARDLLVLQVL